MAIGWLLAVALAEIVALEHARDGVLGRQPDHVGRSQLVRSRSN